ncbi:MAG: putative metal-dependent hydrolase [Acidobacteriales bacterium]|nr:putative metal-dependent hydrolase [Terriglobales bacterium]
MSDATKTASNKTPPTKHDPATDALRFPIGKFHYAGPPSDEQRGEFIASIERTPQELRAAIQGLSDQQLDTPYRDGGWTVRQVVHHVPDSHLNAYVRLKLALTEENPTIKPYDEARWAQLQDSRSTPIEVSLTMLDSLHRRWVGLLRSLSPEDWKRTFQHPEQGAVPLEKNLALYSWHGKHHVAHITELRKRMGW